MKYLFMGRESRMERAEKMALLDRGLTRAAEAIGDVTPAVMALYYARYPEAAASFEHHGLGKTAALEGEMVENCLYCLMHCIAIGRAHVRTPVTNEHLVCRLLLEKK